MSNVVLFAVFTEQVKVEDPCVCAEHSFTIHPSMPLSDQESFDKIDAEKKPWNEEVSI